MNNTTYNFNTFMSWLPELLLALVILVVGFILAKVLENVTRKALRKARLDDRVGVKQEGEPGKPGREEKRWTPERIIAKVVFFGVLYPARRMDYRHALEERDSNGRSSSQLEQVDGEDRPRVD